MRIAVLMTCYNRVETTLGCLQRLVAQKLPAECVMDVWLVDDASPDGTGEKVEEWWKEKIGGENRGSAENSLHVIRSNGGLYWCKGMRLAWDSAMEYELHHSTPTPSIYTYILLLNDDVILKQDAIAGLLLDYEKVGGVIVGTFSSDATEREVSYGATRKIPDGIPHPGEKGLNGNLVLIPREVYEKVGPICGAYHHMYGDYDYGWQVRKHGFEFYSSSRFCGVCPEQPDRYFHLKGRLLCDRWKLLFNPKGYSLHDAILYKYRNWGLMRAMLSIVHIVFKVTFAREEMR